MDQTLINRIVEAALLASSQPLTLAQLYGLFPEDQPAPPGSIEQALQQLREACEGRGVELVEVASGFRYQVAADVHPWVARLWTERKTRYTRATLETLALIAYRQPITRGEIEQVRGVAVSSNIIQALEEREWIRVVGHRDVPGRPALFGTTKGFLDYFGLRRLDDLPPLSELKDIGELEPQLPLDSDGQPAGRIAAGAAADGQPEPEPEPEPQDDTGTDDTEAAAADEPPAGDTGHDNDVREDEPEAAPGEPAADVHEHDEGSDATPADAADDETDIHPEAGEQTLPAGAK
ncbi:SMC-Scp complex subunit ScpB [Stenotrophomonas sp. MMGLT7]|uniref:SMC-Scp complex subunit ScpB n=1 Tax=Stenotrophomonas sp. MMGLT7 TaxID=2901227 RepID=UPI001E643123|nr:SMC-Scp complex subunit ScpB [Stenotrophomonas sp. MMGLT7]MCD7097283.1 SMC-Scp complex subunit ScpB [Stenotrophomonas sp. MMGLT7]